MPRACLRAYASREAPRRGQTGVPSPEEIQNFLRALDGSPWRPLLVTAVFTGMRASELRGLRWDNVEFGDGKSGLK